MLGQLVKSLQTNQNQSTITVSELKEGTYILKVNHNFESITKKIVIQH
jgi:hypothetical protein